MNEIPQIDGQVIPIPRAQEWFVAMVDYIGDGNYWSAGGCSLDKAVAESLCRNSSAQQARIVRVVLPCKEMA